MSYCIGVNRVGLDANNYEYPGHSAIYDALGEKLSNIKPNTDGVEVVVLQKKHVTDVRNKLRFLDDKDVLRL
jgi:predicted amidohydrolase